MLDGVMRSLGQWMRFAWLQFQCCAFAVAIFAGLAVSSVVWRLYDPPMARYDALLLWVLVVQVVFVAAQLETWRELLVICAFHALGLTLEVFKTAVGSWHYPDPGVLKAWGVPIFSGFMYAAVGSYICQAFRRFDLRISSFRWIPLVALAVAAYINFFAHHYGPDLRVWIAVGMVGATWGSFVSFTVGRQRYRMPVALSFLLIGTFLWVAENLATFLGAWKYPDQLQAWRFVHVGKLGSWALLVSLSFVLVAAVKAAEGELYGVPGSRRVDAVRDPIPSGETAPGK